MNTTYKNYQNTEIDMDDVRSLFQQVEFIFRNHPENIELFSLKTEQLTIKHYTDSYEVWVNNILVFDYRPEIDRHGDHGRRIQYDEHVATFRNGNWRLLIDVMEREARHHATPNPEPNESFAPYDLYEDDYLVDVECGEAWIKPTYPITVRTTTSFTEASDLKRHGWEIINSSFDTGSNQWNILLEKA